jgi:SnoaL-like domain
VSETSAGIELARLPDAYAAAVDARDAEALCACFAPMGRLVVIGAGAERKQEYVGREGVHQVIALLERFALTVHHVTTRHLVADGARGRGIVACVAHHIAVRDGQASDLAMHVRYEDEYVRIGECAWCFELRVARVLFTERRQVRVP